ncbi:MAG: response regulator [Armatimonadetes bacterium]|nr:response regulator [Armatimonadota bacterium]
MSVKKVNSVVDFSFQLPAEQGMRGVLLLDCNHQITSIDPGFCELFGVSSSEMIGKDRLQAMLQIPNLRFRNPDAFIESCQGLVSRPKKILDDVFEIVSPTHRVLHRYSSPLFDSEDRCLGRIEIYSDITRRRELEHRVRQAYEELRTTQDQLIQSEKLRAVGEIASGVAHDFNNVLGIILGNIQLLARTTKDEAVLTRLNAMERAALDAAETVRRIREFTKVKPDEPFCPIDLTALATEVVEMLRPMWENSMQAQGSKIEVNIHALERAFALGVAAEIREVLANVLLNAIQAMPSGGKIDIAVGRNNGSSWMRVVDTGVGMSEDVKKRVFDPFFTTRGVEGAGLGMSVAYGIISRHNGNISIESKPGEGTSVTISLPAAFEIPQSDSATPEKGTAKPARILVVEDEEMFAEVFFEMLTECGHAVCIAKSGEEAIEKFKVNNFDIVFTDLGMPSMSGWQVAREIKNIEPRTPVVLLTGWGTSVNQTDVEDSSIDMVLSKPVKFEDLSAIVAEALAKKGS